MGSALCSRFRRKSGRFHTFFFIISEHSVSLHVQSVVCLAILFLIPYIFCCFRSYGSGQPPALRGRSWRTVSHHWSGSAKVPACSRPGNLTGTTQIPAGVHCVLHSTSAPLDRCFFIWDLLLLLHAQSGFFCTGVLLLQVGTVGLVQLLKIQKNYQLFLFEFLSSQDRLRLTIIFPVLLSCGQCLFDEEQETCRYTNDHIQIAFEY